MGVDFQNSADAFIEKVRAATVTANTEVNAVYYCLDKEGQPLEPFRLSLVPTTQVKWPGNPSGAKDMAEKMHRDTIIGNINSLIRPSTPERFFVPREMAGIPMTISRLELEIKESD